MQPSPTGASDRRAELNTNGPLRTRLPGLDGIRAIAVLLVIAYHGEITGGPRAGFLGVDVFFVLSGFLITTLLLREFATTHTLGFKEFYFRRLRRLGPPIFAALTACVLGGLFFAPDTLAALARDIPAALVYASNWMQIFTNQSYFDFVGRPPMLQHFWSLGIEEQFYLIWPGTLLLLVRIGGARAVLVGSTLLFGASTTWMTYLANLHGYPVELEPTRLYVGTDTHSMGLFAGAALAAAMVLRPVRPSSRAGVWRLLGTLCLPALILCAFLIPENSELLYRGGFGYFSILCAGLIWSVLHQDEAVGRLCESRTLRWIGQRSYSLYLWHWPVFQLMRPDIDIYANPWVVLALRIALTVMLSDMTYRYIEVPMRNASLANLTRPKFASIAASLALLAAVLYWTPFQSATVATLAVMHTRPAVPRLQEPESDTDLDAPEIPAASPVASPVPAPASVPVQDPAPTLIKVPNAAPLEVVRSPEIAALPTEIKRVQPLLAQAEAGQLSAVKVLAFGDSVMLGAKTSLEKAVANLTVDAVVGRQAQALLEVLAQPPCSREIPTKVVLHLGTNGFVAERQLIAILNKLQDCQLVVLINAHAPRRWVDANNELFLQASKRYENVTLMDWHTISDGHREYFVGDDIHLTGSGLRAYSTAVASVGHLAPPEKHHAAAPLVPPPAPDNSDPVDDTPALEPPAPEVHPEDSPVTDEPEPTSVPDTSPSLLSPGALPHAN